MAERLVKGDADTPNRTETPSITSLDVLTSLPEMRKVSPLAGTTGVKVSRTTVMAEPKGSAEALGAWGIQAARERKTEQMVRPVIHRDKARALLRGNTIW